MRSIRSRRLRAVVVLALAPGGALVAANAVAHSLGAVVTVAVIYIPVAVVIYVRAGRDGDRAAMIIGGAPDERQALIRRRAWALSGVVMYAAAAISGIAVIALPGIGYWSSYWPFALVVGGGTVTYVAGARAGGLGALIGGGVDERQALIRTRARALSGYAMAAAAVIGAVVQVALGEPFRSHWPFALVLVVGAVGYLAGEAAYGAAHGADYAPGANMEEGEPGG